MNRMEDHITDGPQFEDEPCSPEPEFDPGDLERQEELDNAIAEFEAMHRECRKHHADRLTAVIRDIGSWK